VAVFIRCISWDSYRMRSTGPVNQFCINNG
jgi:hypothetical protein